MSDKRKKEEAYEGFEQGPIRPPSEASSLLVRITRNCPWNRCTFCPVYKRRDFSLRPLDHVLRDIDTVRTHVETVRGAFDGLGRMDREKVAEAAGGVAGSERGAFNAAVNWLRSGGESIFLQDANSLVIKPRDLTRILLHLKDAFPWVTRITSYARSHTIARIGDEDLKSIADAGLNRIHIGMESGSDKVLAMVKKGVDKKTHIKAGLKVKGAGMELSEYVMPGLGGQALSREHALETADALNQIDADFIRLRSLAVPNHVELYEDYANGTFVKCTDLMMAEEILLFLETLDGITGTVKSDHILNLFEEVEGVYPMDKERMTGVVKRFLAMDPERRVLYQVGRRIGLFRGLGDMENPASLSRVEGTVRQYGVTPDNVDEMVDELMKRFI